MPDETIMLCIGGRDYGGWTSVRVSRAIDRMASDFDIAVAERWSASPTPGRSSPSPTAKSSSAASWC